MSQDHLLLDGLDDCVWLAIGRGDDRYQSLPIRPDLVKDHVLIT